MGKLLKYEMRKSWLMKLIVLGVTAVVELVFLVSLFLRDSNGSTDPLTFGMSALLLFIASSAVTLIGIQSVLTLHRDMNTKQGYMLFMTPKSSFQILGAKTLENGLSIALTGAFFFLLGMLDVTLLMSRMGQLEQLWSFFKDFVSALNSEISLSWQSLLLLVVSLLTGWLGTISIAYFADIISSALLNGKKVNGLLTFLFFILLSVLLGWIQGLFRFEGQSVDTSLIIQSVVSLVFAAVMYVLSSLVMDRYLSV